MNKKQEDFIKYVKDTYGYDIQFVENKENPDTDEKLFGNEIFATIQRNQIQAAYREGYAAGYHDGINADRRYYVR